MQWPIGVLKQSVLICLKTQSSQVGREVSRQRKGRPTLQIEANRLRVTDWCSEWWWTWLLYPPIRGATCVNRIKSGSHGNKCTLRGLTVLLLGHEAKNKIKLSKPRIRALLQSSPDITNKGILFINFHFHSKLFFLHWLNDCFVILFFYFYFSTC